MANADFSTPKSVRIGVILVILMLHIAVVFGLIRAFAPDFTSAVVRNVTSAFTVTVTTPPPTPPPSDKEEKDALEEEGEAAPPGKMASPKEVNAPKAKIPLPDKKAPQVAGAGSDISTGARESGEGTGAGGNGEGTGAGGSGSGTGGGGGGGAKVEKIAGDINSARDYPRSGRDLRLGDHVIIHITVGADGRPKGCRVSRPSRDPQAGAVTCELAMKRFRFRPATDAQGRPMEATYGWRQHWFVRGQE